jgi:hypothetical protein
MMQELTTLNTSERYIIDSLVNQFWKRGYLTISRRFGTYLPEPERVGEFKIDVVARQRNKYAIGISLGEDELNNADLVDKIYYLATRHTKFSKKPVILFIGVPTKYYKQVKNLLEQMNKEIRRNIKLIQIIDEPLSKTDISKAKNKVLFS